MVFQTPQGQYMAPHASNGFSETDRGIRLRLRLYGACVSLAALAVFSPAIRYGFVNLDDPVYVVRNEHIRSLDLNLIEWSFTTLTGGNWHPLTWLSLALDYAIWGLNPMGFHLHNILLHAANVFLVMLLVFKVLVVYRDRHRITSSDDRRYELAVAAATAVIFGLHPMRAESVAWVAERKDVLCAFFFLLSLISYFSYATHQDGRRARRGYLLSLAAFSLSLMSKPMAVTLPAVLLLLDFLCLRRASLNDRTSTFRSVIGKVPFLALSSAASLLAIVGQTSGGGMRTLDEHSIADRIINAAHSVWFYAYKTTLPLDLSPFYPIEGRDSLGSPAVIVSIIFVISAAAVCRISYKRGADSLTAIWLYYLVTVLPVAGLIQVGDTGAADRFTYLPSLSLNLLLGMGLIELLRNVLQDRPAAHGVLLPALLLPAVFLAPLTIRQTGLWRDDLSLANRAVEAYPGKSPIPYLDRGFAWLDRNEFQNAVLDCGTALAMRPDCERCLFCRAEALEKMGDLAGALADYNSILRSNPVNANALHNRGEIYVRLGDHGRAQADFRLRDMIEGGQ
ncbi:MAG: hypothetical protein OHK006_06260 [Thermodesulfovibrionales bacterium]